MKFLVTIASLLITQFVSAQQAEDFLIELEEIQINNSPHVQSFVHALHDEKWLIIGGRKDGLHQRQPFAAFLENDNNTMAYVVDPINNITYSANLNVLSQSLYEQLQSTNMQFEQVDTILYIIGGYGFSTTANDHITYANLCAINVPTLINDIIGGNNITNHFRQIVDSSIQVTGGYLDKLDSVFYLAGGQMFEGSYNPMGPNHGPGFIQKYTNAIKKFKIMDDGTNLSITDYSDWVDTVNLHRRDYNMTAQKFPDGYVGLTIFSGVFQYGANLPWLNTVDVRDTGYTIVPNFNQYLNQYHSAHMPVYDGSYNAMHTVFFGGMSRYTLNAASQLVDDTNVPFVNTISRVTRFSDSTIVEFKEGEMDGLLGSGAAFIPLQNTNFVDEFEMIELDSLPFSRVLVGHIIGGIESSQANIFFINDGTQSEASNRIFEVYITKGLNSVEYAVSGDHFFTTNLYPNPTNLMSELSIVMPHPSEVTLKIYSLNGQLIKTIPTGGAESKKTIQIQTGDLSSGIYTLRLSNQEFSKSLKLVIK